MIKKYIVLSFILLLLVGCMDESALKETVRSQSPDNQYEFVGYLSDAALSYPAVFGKMIDLETKKEYRFYKELKQDLLHVNWENNKTIQINGHILNVEEKKQHEPNAVKLTWEYPKREVTLDLELYKGNLGKDALYISLNTSHEYYFPFPKEFNDTNPTKLIVELDKQTPNEAFLKTEIELKKGEELHLLGEPEEFYLNTTYKLPKENKKYNVFLYMGVYYGTNNIHVKFVAELEF